MLNQTMIGVDLVLASSGIDYNVKIWEPRLEEAVRDQTRIDTLIDRNKMILNENRDTIFIPVQFMLPALRLCRLFTHRTKLYF